MVVRLRRTGGPRDVFLNEMMSFGLDSTHRSPLRSHRLAIALGGRSGMPMEDSREVTLIGESGV